MASTVSGGQASGWRFPWLSQLLKLGSGKDPGDSRISAKHAPVVDTADSDVQRGSGSALAARVAVDHPVADSLSKSAKLTPGARLEQLYKSPRADVSLAAVFDLFDGEVEAPEARSNSFMKPGFVGEVLSKTLVANLNNFPRSAQVVQDSFAELFNVLSGRGTGLLSDERRLFIATKYGIIPELSKYSGNSNTDVAAKAKLDVDGISFKMDIRREELKAFRAMKDVLEDFSIANKLASHPLNRERLREGMFLHEPSRKINTLNDLRMALLPLLETHIQGLEGSLSQSEGAEQYGALKEKGASLSRVVSNNSTAASGQVDRRGEDDFTHPSVTLERTIGGKTVGQHLADLVGLEKDFFTNLLLPKYRELMAAIQRSPNSGDLVRDLREGLKSAPPLVGSRFLAQLLGRVEEGIPQAA